jgi:hypothetical protein
MKVQQGKNLFAGIGMNLMIFVLLCIFIGCRKDHCLDCFKSSGKIKMEERALADFGKIVLSDRINLFIRQDSVNRVVVEAGANLLPGIVTKIENEILTIRDDNKCNWVRSYKKNINLYLYCRHLFMIDYKGAGDVKGLNTIVSDSVEFNFWDGSGIISLDLQCRMVRVHLHTGPGDIELTGTTQNALYYARGTGSIKCRNLISGYTYIDSKGTNDHYINCSNELFARISSSGNVYYTGHPGIINTEINAGGSLIPLD